jgi:hypothetical protein
MYVTASASTGWDIPDSSSATASLSQDFILTVTGGQGDGYAETEGLYASGGDPWSGGQAWGSASLGGSLSGCSFESGSDVPPLSTVKWHLCLAFLRRSLSPYLPAQAWDLTVAQVRVEARDLRIVFLCSSATRASR